jgi:acetoacetyl-CoA synthetase
VEYTLSLAMIEMLAPIWQRVLQRPSVHTEDNFFDLGGDPSSAVQLFREINKVSGRALPPITIYQAQTMGALAALVADPRPPRFPALVSLRPGMQEPPVFVSHGLGGSVMEVFHLVKSMKTKRAIYGLQSKGIDGTEQPLERVEDMAEFHLEGIRKLQPRGPYVLIGYSFGGLVMMEIAQRLQERGERVAMLAMVETYPHRHQLPLRMRASLLASLVKRHTAIIGKLPLRKKVAYVTSRAERRCYSSWDDTGTANDRPESGLSFAPALDSLRRGDFLAWMHYRPRFYAGKINFVKATRTNSLFAHDPLGVWTNLAEKLEIDTIPGDHFGIVTTHSELLAAVLSRHLAAAFSEE